MLLKAIVIDDANVSTHYSPDNTHSLSTSANPIFANKSIAMAERQDSEQEYIFRNVQLFKNDTLNNLLGEIDWLMLASLVL